jgi:hypothetical protein
MRYREENLVEKSLNNGYKKGYRERRLEIAKVGVYIFTIFIHVVCQIAAPAWISHAKKTIVTLTYPIVHSVLLFL